MNFVLWWNEENWFLSPSINLISNTSNTYPSTKWNLQYSTLKAYVSQEILNWHSLRHSHSVEFWIICLCLACLSQLSTLILLAAESFLKIWRLFIITLIVILGLSLSFEISYSIRVQRKANRLWKVSFFCSKRQF